MFFTMTTRSPSFRGGVARAAALAAAVAFLAAAEGVSSSAVSARLGTFAPEGKLAFPLRASRGFFVTDLRGRKLRTVMAPRGREGGRASSVRSRWETSLVPDRRARRGCQTNPAPCDPYDWTQSGQVVRPGAQRGRHRCSRLDSDGPARLADEQRSRSEVIRGA